MPKKKRIVKGGHSRGDMLTNKQERFVQELVKGKSQREAYRIAYPSAVKWQDKNVDSKASNMLKIGKIKARYEELKRMTAEKVTYDVAEIRKMIIDTELAILRADVADDDVDGRAVKNKRWDSKNRVVYEHYDKQEAIKVLREMLGIDPVDTGNGITIKIENGQGYDE